MSQEDMNKLMPKVLLGANILKVLFCLLALYFLHLRDVEMACTVLVMCIAEDFAIFCIQHSAKGQG
jgi:hypothetical protein